MNTWRGLLTRKTIRSNSRLHPASADEDLSSLGIDPQARGLWQLVIVDYQDAAPGKTAHEGSVPRA